MPSRAGTSPLLRASFAVVLTVLCGSLAGGSPRLSATPQPQPRPVERRAALQPDKLAGKRAELKALRERAEAHAGQGEAQRALEIRKQILERAREEPRDLDQETLELLNLGAFYSSHLRLDESWDYLGQALQVCKETNDDKCTAHVYLLVGWAYYLAGNPGIAMAFYDRAIPLYRQEGYDYGRAGALDRKGSALLALGRLDEAIAQYQQALGIFKDLSREMDQASTLSNIGRIYDMRGNARQAREFWSRALGFFRKRGYRENEAAALLGLALAERHAGNLKLALSRVREAIRIIESQQAGVDQEKLRISYFSSRYDYYEALIDLLMRLHLQEPGRGHDVEAFEVSDRGRARTLLANLASAEIDRPWDPALQEREKALETQLVSAILKASGLREQGRPREEVEAAERDLRSLWDQLDELRRRSVSRPRTSPRAASLREIQATLDDDTVILEYILLPDKSYLWVIGRDSFESHELEGRKEIEERSRKLHDLISDKKKLAFKEREALADLVVGPALPRLRGKRLLVVPDGALHLAPFQALRIPSPSGPGHIDMIDEHEVYDLPSASVAVELRRKLAGRRPAPGLLALLADAVFTTDDERLGRDRRAERLAPGLERSLAEVGLSDLPRLDGSRREALGILDLLPPGERALWALDFAANRGLMRSGRLARYRYLHLAVHGILDPEQPELSSLVFSRVHPDGSDRNGFLWAYEIYDLDLPAELVVLSACRTAVGREFRGEGPMSLGRAFLHAGAARVIVSRWNVNDNGAAELMQRFYEGLLRQGLRPGEALRKAQLATKDDPKRRTPYYWAVFSLQGEWN